MNYEYKVEVVHKDTIKVGHTIEVDNEHFTICESDIKYDSFMGKSIRGNAYPKVRRVFIKRVTRSQVIWQ